MKVRREIPGTGLIFSSTDLHVGELYAHAQSCIWLLGYSDQALSLLDHKDPHSEGAAVVMNLSYDDFMVQLKKVKNPKAKAMRQAFKPWSFGKPTGMGDVKIVISNRKMGPDTPCAGGPVMILDGDDYVPGYKGTRFCILVDGASRCGYHPDGRPNKRNTWGRRGREEPISPTCCHCLEVAGRLGDAWKRKARENSTYGNLIADFVESGMIIRQEALDRWPWLQDWYEADTQLKPGQVMQHHSGVLRGGLNFTNCANTFFQALVGELTKAAFWRASMECYDRTIRVPLMAHENSRPSKYAGGPSPLFGSRLIGFFHDEIFGEHQPAIAHDAAMRLQEIMEEEEAYYLPDLAKVAKAEPCLMSGAWDKRSEPRWRDGFIDPKDVNARADHSKRGSDADILVPWVAPPPRIQRRAVA